MVTNERQRQYASESRKNRSKTKSKGGNDSETLTDDASQPNGNQISGDRSRRPVSSSPFPDIDPKLNQYHYEVEEPQPSEDGQDSTRLQGPNRFTSAFPIKPPDASEVKYIVNILKDGQ